jgi:hypothetical protein
MMWLLRITVLFTTLAATAATGYDPLRDDAPDLAETLAASVDLRPGAL